MKKEKKKKGPIDPIPSLCINCFLFHEIELFTHTFVPSYIMAYTARNIINPTNKTFIPILVILVPIYYVNNYVHQMRVVQNAHAIKLSFFCFPKNKRGRGSDLPAPSILGIIIHQSHSIKLFHKIIGQIWKHKMKLIKFKISRDPLSNIRGTYFSESCECVFNFPLRKGQRKNFDFILKIFCFILLQDANKNVLNVSKVSFFKKKMSLEKGQ